MSDIDRIRKEMAERRQQIREHSAALQKLKDECPHLLRDLTTKELADEWMSVGASCIGCGTDFGWRCKESPDSVCHYYSEDGQIELINGTMVPIPADHDPDFEINDCCIFCGMPDERK